jgi:peptidylprolyl isomerase
LLILFIDLYFNLYGTQGNLAFGAKGRPASAGTPRIPANAEITFDVEMVGLPGKEPELIDIIGD